MGLYSCSWEISWFSALHSISHTPRHWENWGSRRFLSPILRNNWTRPGTYLRDTARRPHGLDFKSKRRAAILVLLRTEHNLSVSQDSIWKVHLSCELSRGQRPNLAVVLRSGGFWNVFTPRHGGEMSGWLPSSSPRSENGGDTHRHRCFLLFTMFYRV